MTTEALEQLCRDYFTAFLKRDVAWMQKHIAPTFVRHDPGLPFEVRGPAGVAQLHDALMPAFPDMRLPLEECAAGGVLSQRGWPTPPAHGGHARTH
jgi:hypothetical protein